MSPSRPIEQALHGYRSGHRLLGSSVDLSAHDKRFLSVVTDSADVGRTPGWDALLAGYPLPSNDWFGLSMTWPGSEDSRAGAVWTHTILLDRETVALADRIDLTAAFTRPDSLDDLSAFSKPITVGLNDSALLTGYDEWSAETNWVLHQLPVRPVELVTTAPPETRHQLLINLWIQLWPELRASWSFAEAPSTRKSGFERSPDLQVLHRPQGVPDEEVRVVQGTLARRAPEWAQVLADLKRGDESSVHDFLDQYGPEAHTARDAVAPLSQIWLAIERSRASIRVLETVERVATSFSQDDEMEALKGDLLQGRLLRGTSQRIPSDEAIIAALQVGDEAFGSSPVTSMALDAIDGMTADEVVRTLAAALETPTTGLANKILNLVAETFAEAIPSWPHDQQELIFRVVRARPQIAANPEVWKTAEPSLLWPAVRPARTQKLRRPIAHAMVLSGATVPEGDVATAWSNVYDAALAAVAQEDVDPVGAARWLAAGTSEQVGKWANMLLESDPDRFAQLAEVIPPDVISTIPVASLKGLAGRPDARPTTLMSVFLAAVRDGAQSSAEVATLSYDRLYPLAREEGLGGARTQLDKVEIDVPPWDAALRVARLLNRAFKKQGWPLAPIFCLHSEPFKALISADSKAGLARRLVAAEVEPSKWQKTALADVIADRADKDGVRELVLSVLSRVNPF